MTGSSKHIKMPYMMQDPTQTEYLIGANLTIIWPSVFNLNTLQRFSLFYSLLLIIIITLC